jgi:3-dehydroquinate dehydratase/shikimate dehydrogenase
MGCNLIVPIVRAAPSLRAQVQAAVRAGADLIELRVDRIGDIAAVDELLREPHAKPYILTVRTREEGGAWDGDEADRVALIERLGLLMPGYIDFEFAAWMRSANLRQKIGLVCQTGSDESSGRPKNKLILSHHNLHRVPDDADLARIVSSIQAQQAAVTKVVFTPRDATDALRIVELSRFGSDARPLIALGMGDAGLLTRVMAGSGNLFGVFAALDPTEQSAPGQPTIDELLGLYRWNAISRATRYYGLIGWPVSHSQSPRIHNAAMAAAAIDGVYIPLPVAPDEDAFRRFMQQVQEPVGRSFAGFSVTIPHKEHALRWLLAAGLGAGPIARRCGAVNTLIRAPDGRFFGHNTDASAAWSVLATAAPEIATNPADVTVLILGAGGAARGIAAAVLERGCRVCVANRSPARAGALSADLGCESVAWEGRASLSADVVINCTSVGMTPNVSDSPLPAAALRAGQIVFDTVYTPADTRLLRDAAAAGCRVISGRALFLAQAAEQFRLWHAQTAAFPAIDA